MNGSSPQRGLLIAVFKEKEKKKEKSQIST